MTDELPCVQQSAAPRARAIRRLPHTFALLLGLAGATAGTPAGAGAAEAPATAAAVELRVGRMTLHRCRTPAPWCGTLTRPLDPTGAVAGTISVYFEDYPHSAPGPAAGTLVATEGGPGYPATDSRDEYLALFAPLRARYDVLIMDNRGTGRSGAVDCRELQNAPQLTEANIGACGRALGRSAPLYGTALATDDLAAVLDALAIGRIGLYGDSYGTFFAQTFALRHPDRLRALVLDGAYPLDGPDYGWFPHYAPATREKFNLACRRAPACSSLPGSSLEHIAAALELLRKRPFTARVRDDDGRLATFTADATALAIVMYGGSPAYATVRELDAAARAFAAGDQPPLLRLMAETAGSVDSRDPTRSPQKFSSGLAAAVFCQDSPQIFDMRLPPAQRIAERERLIAARERAEPGMYAPFTFGEYRRMPLDYAFIDECVEWPVIAQGPPAAPLIPAAARYPDVPVLVVSGELDNMTTVADGAAAAARFPHARHVVIANSFHVNALPDARSECGAVLVRRFLDTLKVGDTGCAAAVPPVRLVPRFARTARELTPARALAGNQAGTAELSVVSAALFTAADVITRTEENGPGKGLGLRGGTFASEAAGAGGAGLKATLRDVRWTGDVAVSGQIEWPGRTGAVQAHLKLQAPGGGGTLEIAWPQAVSPARATVHGDLAGRAVVAEAPAP
jgi:pimeloyl-ACP methyl ester carboxylesterase